MPKINWISHRGHHREHIENTKKAFDTAVNAGFLSLETDLRTTIDGHIVLHHDSSMKKTSNQDIFVEQITLERFQSVNLIDGQKGMSFAEFAREYAACSWILDIKPESAKRTILNLRKWCDSNQSEAWLMSNARFLLWSDEHETFLKEKFPMAITLAKETECLRAGVSALLGLKFLSGIKKDRVYALPPSFMGIALFNKRIVSSYKKKGARVLAYLPEADIDIKRAVRCDVDEILTNGLPHYDA